MVIENKNLIFAILEILLPYFKSFNNGQKLAIKDFIVDFYKIIF